jgi:hypothetical protein
LIKKNQKIKAADNFGASVFLLAHTIQLVVQLGFARCPPQTVLLTKPTTASLKTVAISQNSLRPGEIKKILILLKSS